MFILYERCRATLQAATIFFVLSLATATAEPLTIIGSAEITMDGKSSTYYSVRVVSQEHDFRSSSYTDYHPNDEYGIAITAYEDPEPHDDLDSIVPVRKGPLITVYAYMDSEGKETRDPRITWEIDPERHFYWESDEAGNPADLELESFDLDPDNGHFKGVFRGEICYVSLPVIKVDRSNCKDVVVRIDTELTKLY